MTWTRLGRQLRAVRLRSAMRQEDVARRGGVSRSTVSLVERGRVDRLSIGMMEAVVSAVGARLDARLSWHGPELDRLVDAGHAALTASVKRRLEKLRWVVRVEVSYNHFGERGRMDLLAWEPATATVLVVEAKTSLADIQALLGSMDTKTRVVPHVVRGQGWQVSRIVPAIVFLEDRTTRRHLGSMAGLFDRYELRGKDALRWLRDPASAVPSGLLWLQSVPNARVIRVSGQRVRKPSPARRH